MRKHFFTWLKARRTALFYTAAVFGFFFLVYALYGYEWGVAGYAALLGTVFGALLAVWDFIRFVTRASILELMTGRFPAVNFPEPKYSLEMSYQKIIAALEKERARLEAENDFNRRDAEEYYTLWAHQIKTPIAAAKLLLQSNHAGISGAAKNDLEQEILRINQYADMVLQYQRLSSIENDLSLKRFEILYLVKQAAKNCAELFIYKGIALETENVSGSIVTDEKWFCFVLEQIFTNAVKYTRKGTVRVYCDSNEINGEQRESGRKHELSREWEHTLIIEDSGIGIPAEDLPRVFERGFTGAVGRSERSSTGIGLYLCKRILNRLGFGISIESETGKGTRAVLHLAQKELEID